MKKQTVTTNVVDTSTNDLSLEVKRTRVRTAIKGGLAGTSLGCTWSTRSLLA
jgi:hypothetical protein